MVWSSAGEQTHGDPLGELRQVGRSKSCGSALDQGAARRHRLHGDRRDRPDEEVRQGGGGEVRHVEGHLQREGEHQSENDAIADQVKTKACPQCWWFNNRQRKAECSLELIDIRFPRQILSSAVKSPLLRSIKIEMREISSTTKA